MRYIEGEQPEATVETYQKLGEIAADLHSVSDYPIRTLFDPQVIIQTQFVENAKKFSFGEEYLKVAKSLPDFSQFPQTLIHTDIAPANSVETKEEKIFLTDWDDAGIGPTVLDLGYPLLGQFTTEDREIRQDLAEAFYTAYFAKRQISQDEKAALFDASLFFALMYVIHGEAGKRWQRIKWATANRKAIEQLIP